MTTKSEDLAACDELKIYKHEDEDYDIELKQSSEEVKEFLHKDLLSNYVRPQLFGGHFFFNNAFGNYNNNFYRNNYHTTTTSASSFPNCAANSLTAAEIRTCSGFQPLANSFNQSKFHNDFINKHSSSINSFSPPTLSSNLSSTTNLINKSQDSPLITNPNLANSLTAAEIRTCSSFQPLANSFNQSKFHNDFINKHSSSINSFSPPTLSSNLTSTANFTNKSQSSPLITSANLAALSHAAHLYSNSLYEQYGSVMNLAAMSKLHQQQSFVDAIYNCGFNSNSMLSVCPPQSSSANSAANALSAFSLTDSDRKPFYSSTANSHSSSSNNRTSPNKSTDYNKSNGNTMNSITSSSKRTSTPVSSNSSSLTSPLMNDFNTLNQMPFNQINQHISQHLNHRLSQHLHGFDIDYTKRNFLDPVHHNPLSQSSSANLNTSNSDSLGSLNDSTGDLSDSMSKSISNSVNQDNSDNNQPHIKKPLNAFMLFMQDNRPHVLAESTLKESAAINKKLGEMWRNLSHKEQEKYIEKAKDLRELHFKLYPNWTAKNNYAINIRKKKRKKEKSTQMRQFKEYTNSGVLKKCRARYTMKQRDKWCKPCLRKKKCEKYKDNPASS